MARATTKDDSWDDDDDPDNDPNDADGNEMVTVDCPHCRREIPEDALRCPYCEQYLSLEDSPSPRKPWWVIVGFLLCLFAVYRWIMM